MKKTNLSKLTMAIAVASLLPISAACSSAKPADAPAPAPAADSKPATPAADTKPAEKPADANAVDIVRDAAEVPAPITRTTSEKVVVHIEAKEVVGKMADGTTFRYWTYGGKVPGPMVRVREGDTVELHLSNAKDSMMPHSIDVHAVSGPGGGAGVLQVKPGEEKVLTFKALQPGMYIYHCGTSHIPTHIGHGMYGMFIVEPKEGLPKVDKEFYMMQGEWYTQGAHGTKGHLEFDSNKLLDEKPEFVTFNGAVAGLTGDHAMKAKVGDKVRVYIGDGGPNLTSSIHAIGEIFDTVYPNGSTTTLHNVQTQELASGSGMAVELTINTPGDYVFVDHSISRAIDKGAVAILHADGDADKAIFDAPAGAKSE